MTAIKTNQAELTGWLQENPCPVIDVHCHPNDLEARAKWLKDFAFKCDELIYAVASDSAEHVSCITPSTVMTRFQDALDESSFPFDLENAAYDALEDMRERQLEHS